MDCFLPSSALERKAVSVDEECRDSTRCVDSVGSLSSSGNGCDVSTPVCNGGGSGTASVSAALSDSDAPLPAKDVSASEEVGNGVETELVDAGASAVCRSPSVSFVDRLARLRKATTSFALDDSMSNVSICDGDLSVCMDTYDTIDCLNVDSKSPETYTPIKSVNSSNRSLEVLNSIHTRLDEPHVNISDDEDKNPVLASSIRRVSTKKPEVDRSLEVLGSSRCWTDRFDNDLTDPSLSATQSPVRSLASVVNSSQAENSEGSFRRGSALRSLSPVCTPIRSYSRSVSRLPAACRYDALDRFKSLSVSEMMRMSSNPMCNVGLSREDMCKVRLSEELEMLYRHFKNLCTVMRRSAMRNDEPYFRVLQLLVQRMSRRSFTMDHLLQMVWLAPNLVSIRWVLVGESCKKKYSAEYKESTDRVYDISIRLLSGSGSPSDAAEYEGICFRFKTILCCWSLKCVADKVDSFRVPTARVPDKRVRSAHSTPRRDCTPIRLDDLTPVRSFGRLEPSELVGSTPTKSFRMLGSDSTLASAKRTRTVDVMSPMSVDLLDTPGMRRIRENARRLASERRECVKRDDDLKFWIDMRWFTKILLEMIVGDTSPVMKIEFLVDFMMKYGSRKVNQGQVTQWVNALSEIDPSIIYKTVSKFEDYSTVLTLNKSASLDNAVDYINQKIKTLKSF